MEALEYGPVECQGKLLYATAAEAQYVLDRIRKRAHGRRRDLHVYRCSAGCEGYHLGRERRLPRSDR